MEEHHAFDPKTEHVLTRVVEMVCESVPETMLQLYVLLKERHTVSRATVGGVLVSAMTTGFSSASISFDFDVDPALRKQSPDFYGYIPDDGSRTVIFGCMILNSALLLLIQIFSAALFGCSMSSTRSSEPPLKKVKVEHEPDGPLGCKFCMESCRGRGKGVDAMVCNLLPTPLARINVRRRHPLHPPHVSDSHTLNTSSLPPPPPCHPPPALPKSSPQPPANLSTPRCPCKHRCPPHHQLRPPQITDSHTLNTYHSNNPTSKLTPHR